MPSDFVTDQMEEALTALQAVKPFDYDAAYGVAYRGIAWIDPRNLPAGAELIYGRSLALNLWTRRMTDTNRLRAEARS